MKKKFLAILTIAAMTLSFTACGDSDKKTTEEKTTTESTSGGQDLQHSIELDGNILTPDENDGIDITATRGTVENNAFTNETFKISFPTTDTMRFLSDKEIADLIGLTTEHLTENEKFSAEQLETATNGTIYDAYVYLDELGSNVSITYRLTPYTEQQYAESTIQELTSLTSPKYTIDPITTAKYGGQTYTVISANTDMGFNQKLLFRREGKYLITITLTIVEGQEALGEDFLNSLTEVQ